MKELDKLPRPPGGAFLYDRDKKAPPKRGLVDEELPP
jgi:hypothetical protein